MKSAAMIWCAQTENTAKWPVRCMEGMPRAARPGSYPERARVRAREVHIWEATSVVKIPPKRLTLRATEVHIWEATSVVKLPEESESESKTGTHLGSHFGGEATRKE